LSGAFQKAVIVSPTDSPRWTPTALLLIEKLSTSTYVHQNEKRTSGARKWAIKLSSQKTRQRSSMASSWIKLRLIMSNTNDKRRWSWSYYGLWQSGTLSPKYSFIQILKSVQRVQTSDTKAAAQC